MITSLADRCSVRLFQNLLGWSSLTNSAKASASPDRPLSSSASGSHGHGAAHQLAVPAVYREEHSAHRVLPDGPTAGAARRPARPGPAAAAAAHTPPGHGRVDAASGVLRQLCAAAVAGGGGRLVDARRATGHGRLTPVW